MTNKMTKFLTMGALALAVVIGGNALTQHYSTDNIQAPVAATQVEKNERLYTLALTLVHIHLEPKVKQGKLFTKAKS